MPPFCCFFFQVIWAATFRPSRTPQFQKRKKMAVVMKIQVKDYKLFWQAHETHSRVKVDSLFKDLIERMLDVNPKTRATLKEVEEHKWSSGKVLSKEELLKELRRKKPAVDEGKRLEAMEAKNTSSGGAGTRAFGAYRQVCCDPLVKTLSRIITFCQAKHTLFSFASKLESHLTLLFYPFQKLGVPAGQEFKVELTLPKPTLFEAPAVRCNTLIGLQCTEKQTLHLSFISYCDSAACVLRIRFSSDSVSLQTWNIRHKLRWSE
jgi:serine/threonine protein kinase